jgi:hypothetical protein
MFAFPDSAVGFIQTHFYWPYQYHGDATRNENMIQDLVPNRIIGLLDAYKELMHTFIVLQFFLKYLTSAEYMTSSGPVALKSTLMIPNNFLCICC